MALFTQAQKRNILDANRQKNKGILRSDQSGEQAVQPQQSTKGVKPPDNEAQVDHIQPKSLGGPNSYKNAQVLTRKENIQKSDTPPSQ
ncbi:MAG TPA: HNH endonuclease signature motif containing protein [Candidatus Cybelea sp.]|jgi:5-methylcytosine-specific restriction endonuclease McrA|nr:HNH endonuclease signature motif containing protein [Candidatus Cybelea sp.]